MFMNNFKFVLFTLYYLFCFFEACELQFIMDYAVTEATPTESRDQIFAMRITKENYWLLAQSLIHYLSYDFANMIAKHKAFWDPEFLRFFFTSISKHTDDVLMTEDGDVTVSAYVDYHGRSNGMHDV